MLHGMDMQPHEDGIGVAAIVQILGRVRDVAGIDVAIAVAPSSMISNFSDAEYLMKRPPHPRERFF
jgi:hypothetical protein